MIYTKEMCKELFGGTANKTFSDNVKMTAPSEISPKDVIKYWVSKAHNRGIKYIVAKYKDAAIAKSVAKEFSYTEVIDMIDYLWESGEQIATSKGFIPYTDYGLYLLSANWVNATYNRAKEWKMSRKFKTSVIDERGWDNRGKESVEVEF